jgi:hypothetical protein
MKTTSEKRLLKISPVSHFLGLRSGRQLTFMLSLLMTDRAFIFHTVSEALVRIVVPDSDLLPKSSADDMAGLGRNTLEMATKYHVSMRARLRLQATLDSPFPKNRQLKFWVICSRRTNRIKHSSRISSLRPFLAHILAKECYSQLTNVRWEQ